MPQDFYPDSSEEQHYGRMKRLQSVRDELSEVITHFYDYPPKSQEEYDRYIRDMKYRLDGVWRDLDGYYKSL